MGWKHSVVKDNRGESHEKIWERYPPDPSRYYVKDDPKYKATH